MKTIFKRIGGCLLIAALILTCWVGLDDTSSYAASTIKKPVISSLKASGTTITVKSKKNTAIDGFQLQYSTVQTFKTKKSVLVKSQSLNKKITGLKKGKTYFVRVRSYKTAGSAKNYSSWSEVKSVDVPKIVYTKDLWTTLFAKKSASSSTIRVWYKSKLKIVGSSTGPKGTWSKVKYNNKVYYLWESKGVSKTTTKKPVTDYTNTSYTDYQNEVLKKAMSIYKTKTKYDYTHKVDAGKKASDGRYPYDCSHFTAAVLNSVMQKDCPAYNISSGDIEQYKTYNVLNEGLDGEFNAKTICKGKPDFSLLEPGDVLFFKEDPKSKTIDHVAIYLGNKEIMQSTKMYQRNPSDLITVNGSKKNAGGVCIAPLNKGKYYDGFIAAKRFIPSGFKEANIETSVKEFTGIYSTPQCSGNKLVSLSPGNTLTILYTLNRGGDGKKIAYVKTSEGKKGYVIASKLKL